MSCAGISAGGSAQSTRPTPTTGTAVSATLAVASGLLCREFPVAWGAFVVVFLTADVYKRQGKPLSPETGYDFDGRLGQMQGVLVAPNGDVWTVDNENSQVVHLPGGDVSKGRILGRTVDGKPVDGTLRVKGPFGIAIDQQDRIWITNSGSNTVTHFPASDPGRAEEIEAGFSPVSYTQLSLSFAVLFSSSLSWPASASAADRIEGQVKGGGSPIAKADVTLWVTTGGGPRKLAQTRTCLLYTSRCV